MKKNELREVKLLELLKNGKRLDIGFVVKTLDISEATARRLFSRLEKERKLIRVHGGIQTAPEIYADYSFNVSVAKNLKEKSIIGSKAAMLVEDGDRIFLDAGTTVLKMAESLSMRIKTGELKGITVITNSLSYVSGLASCCDVILVGGKIRPERCDVCGAIARQNLEKMRFDKVFFGVDAISPDGELMTTDADTAELNALFIRHSARSYVLADSSKFNRTSLMSFALVSDMTRVITEKK